jgi:hypothetical protein
MKQINYPTIKDATNPNKGSYEKALKSLKKIIALEKQKSEIIIDLIKKVYKEIQ